MMAPILKRFGKRVRELRLKQGLTQEDLAWESHLDRTYVSGIERGTRNVALKNIEKIAKALKVGIAKLFETVD